MAVYANDLIMDAALDYIASNGSRICVCSSEPNTYAHARATTGAMLAETTVAITSGEYTLANGDTSGRKVSTPQKADMTIAASGVADHVAIVSTGLTALISITLCTTQQLTTGNTVTVPTFDQEIADATTP